MNTSEKKLPVSFASPEDIIPILLDEVDLLERNPQLPADPGSILCILICLTDALLVSNVPVTHEEAKYFIACAMVRVKLDPAKDSKQSPALLNAVRKEKTIKIDQNCDDRFLVFFGQNRSQILPKLTSEAIFGILSSRRTFKTPNMIAGLKIYFSTSCSRG